MQLEGKLAAITGGGRGIGRAMALAFAQKRADLALLDLNQSDLDQARAACEEHGVRARTYLCNVTRESNYSATKAGVVAMTVVWAKEPARYGIRTGAIAPGFTRTEILDAMKPEMIERAVAAVPLKRMAEPAEMAHAAVFIAENDYFSGRVIEVDGGQRI